MTLVVYVDHQKRILTLGGMLVEHSMMANIAEGIAEVRETLAKADRIVEFWESGPHDEDESVKYFLESAFIRTRMLLEVSGFFDSLKSLRELQQEAQKDYTKVDLWEEGLYLYWGSRLRPYLDALAAISGGEKTGIVARDVIEILKNTEYSITDQKCFPKPPASEGEVHARIEAILKCVFVPLRHKPAISKPIKNFEPDTGLPAVKTLIEYKFVKSEDDVRRVSDEILADTRGYTSKDWNRFVYVIYETRRFESEKKWNEHLRECATGDNTSVVVLRGEAPPKSKSARR
jgi:hypothetical protein